MVQKAYLDYVREDYGESIKADDDAYLIANLEKAFEESGGCPVHTTEILDPVDPNNPDDPLDPYDPDAPFVDDDPNNPNNQTPDDETNGTGQEEWWANIIGPAPGN